MRRTENVQTRRRRETPQKKVAKRFVPEQQGGKMQLLGCCQWRLLRVVLIATRQSDTCASPASLVVFFSN